MGDMGRLCFPSRLAGWLSEGCGVEGTSFAAVTLKFIISESEERLELLPKDGVHLSDLEVVGASKESARFIF